MGKEKAEKNSWRGKKKKGVWGNFVDGERMELGQIS